MGAQRVSCSWGSLIPRFDLSGLPFWHWCRPKRLGVAPKHEIKLRVEGRDVRPDWGRDKDLRLAINVWNSASGQFPLYDYTVQTGERSF